MDAPVIRSAVPKRRYQFGEYNVVVLGEVESGDGRDYQYVLGVVREGASKPFFFVTAERGPQGPGRQRIRVIAEGFNEDMGVAEGVRTPDDFVSGVIPIVSKALGLADEALVPLS